jgi:hypothetical protein
VRRHAKTVGAALGLKIFRRRGRFRAPFPPQLLGRHDAAGRKAASGQALRPAAGVDKLYTGCRILQHHSLRGVGRCRRAGLFDQLRVWVITPGTPTRRTLGFQITQKPAAAANKPRGIRKKEKQL